MKDRSNPYTPPPAATNAEPTAESGVAGKPRRRPSAAWMLGLSVATFISTIFLVGVEGPEALFGGPGILGFGATVFLALVGRTRRGGVLVAAANLLMAGLGGIGALLSTFGRGRQLRHLGRVQLPPVVGGAAWARRRLDVEDAALAPAGVARQWRENGRTEHASVAAFARLTLDLMALGAPPTLIAAASEDALDEIRHAEACFALARALDGRSESPGAFPEAQRVSTLPRSRTLALARLAVSSLVDGALHEGISARAIATLARRCESPAIRAVLRQLAADEGRHAAHGWDVVEWCLEQGRAPVGHALLGALLLLPQHIASDRPVAAANGAWERWGIHGHALEMREHAAARAQLVERVHALVDPLRQAA